MDPQRAFELIAAAGASSVPLGPQGRVNLFQLSNSDCAEIKSLKRTNDNIRVAKKYVAVKEALDELEKSMSGFPEPYLSRMPQPYSNSVPIAGNTNSAIVPFVPVAPIQDAAWAAKFEHGPFLPTLRVLSLIKSSSIYKRYISVCGWMLWLGLYLPLVVGIIYTLYFVWLWLYIAGHPEVIVKCVFEMLRWPRDYANYATQRTLKSLVYEMTGISIWAD